MIRVFTILLAWGLLAASAAAQVRMTQGGRALDRNYRLGSGGINSRTSAPGLSSNLYVTGQVTGGLSFRGRVPYAADNELRLTLPSEALENFNRDSMGLDRIISGDPFVGQSFYRTSSTVRDVNTLVSDQVSAGAAGIPMPQLVLPVRPAATAKLYGDALAPYLAPTEPGMPAIPWRTDAGVNLDVAAAVATATQQETRPQISEIFGVLRSVESDRVAVALAEGLRPGVEEGVAAGSTPQRVQPVIGEGTDEPPPAQPERGTGASWIAPVEDEDVFLEMLMALQARNEFAAGLATAPMPEGATEVDPERLDVEPTRHTMFAKKRDSTIIEATDKQIVVHGLAGRGKDLFARFMQRGDQAMKEGMFYAAAERYDSARRLRRSNPLPAVGAGLAYLAAGEAFRASDYLRLAIVHFQPLMEVRLDVGEIIGQKMAERRLREIQDRLASPAARQEMPLVFLMTFLHANRGDAAEAKHWAEKLKPMVEENKALTAYAEYLITGARPAEIRSRETGSGSPPDAAQQ